MRKVLFVVGLIMILSSVTVFAAGQKDGAAAAYPERDIRVIIHVTPGGGTDTMAKTVLRFAGEKLGINFVVENHKGAGGQLGYTTLSMAEPDGYTIGTMTTMSCVTHELTREDIPYTLKDSFIPIARIVLAPSGFYVPQDSPFKNLKDLIKYARSHPGELTVATDILWGTHHVQLKLLEKAAGIQMTNVPFDGSADVRAAILGGHVDAAMGGFAYFAPLVAEGKLRGLAVGAPERSVILDSVPTYREEGYDIVIGSNRGFSAPVDTPKEYIDTLSAVFKEVLEDPVFLVEAEKIGIEKIIGYLAADDYRAYLLNLQNEMREMLKKVK